MDVIPHEGNSVHRFEEKQNPAERGGPKPAVLTSYTAGFTTTPSEYGPINLQSVAVM
jgi:hypothetical protein